MSGLTNAKNNFFARMLGKTSKDKSMFPQQEVGISQAPAPGTQPMSPQAMQGNGFMAQMLPNYVGPGAQSYPSQPAVQVGSQPTQTTQPQTQAGQSEQSGTVGAPSSRYRLMEMMEARPERDAEGMATLQKRSKINAIGKGFSALAGLGGMAMGGDAPVITDSVTPWNMNQMQIMDQDYRNRLQDWVNRSFQVEAANTQTLNREVDQQIDSENRMEQIQVQGENARQLAAQRASDALNQLLTKSEIDQIKEMQKVGVDPNSENAYGEYLQKMASKFNSDLNYTKARTNWNNRPATGGGRSGKEFAYPLDVVQKGRDLKVSQLEQQKAEALKTARTPSEKEAVNKRFDSMIDDYRKYNPGANELMDMEMAQLGGAEQGGGQEGQPTAQAPQGYQFDPSRGFITNVPRSKDPVIKAQADKTLSEVIPLLAGGDFSRGSEALQAIIDMGLADSEESAEEVLYNLLYSEEDQDQ
jgi:hypothetical protein